MYGHVGLTLGATKYTRAKICDVASLVCLGARFAVHVPAELKISVVEIHGASLSAHGSQWIRAEAVSVFPVSEGASCCRSSGCRIPTRIERAYVFVVGNRSRIASRSAAAEVRN